MNKVKIVAGGSAVLSTLVGAGAGYLFAKKRIEKQYEGVIDEEVAKAKDFYAKLNKVEEFSSPAEALKTLHPEEELLTAATNAMASYKGQRVTIVEGDKGISAMSEGPVETFEHEAPPESSRLAANDDGTIMTTEIQTTVETTSVFLNGQELDRDAFDLEAERDLRRNGVPYVVSQMEFDENPDKNEQVVLTYFAGDDTLCDEDEKEIDDVNGTVGNASLQRFGAGSNDSKIVYVRNESRGMDYEILRSEGRFSEEVLGLTHDDDHLAHSAMRSRGSRRVFDE